MSGSKIGLETEDATLPKIASVDLFWRTANFLSVAQLYLHDNILLTRPLSCSDFKPTILGHWGAIPSINFIYAHLSDFARRSDLPILFVLGTGHAAPALLSTLYIEESLMQYYPYYSHTLEGLTTFVQNFAWQDGFQTEVSAHVPSMILAGGELGQALSVAQGAALDQPDLIVACVVGDGEMETGAAASALLGSKYLHSTVAGVFLPIINLNGFKMGSASLLSTFSDAKLQAYFHSQGYEPIIVGPSHSEMANALSRVLKMITQRRSSLVESWPLIVLRSPKGWTGPTIINGLPFEGTVASHKPVLRHPATSEEEASIIEAWLRSYQPEELFRQDGSLQPKVLQCLPMKAKRLGMQWKRFGPPQRIPLTIPASEEVPQAIFVSATEKLANLIGSVFSVNNENLNFRLFSPDELSSNRLSSILTHTSLCQPVKEEKNASLSSDGRVMEILSEQVCQGWLQGYLQTGRHGLFATYEAFAPIVASMAGQYCKFLKDSIAIPWRLPTSSLNYLLTSLGWHNCYTHQNPDFIGTLLARPLPFIRIYTPPDANSCLVCMTEILSSSDRINAIVVSKVKLPVWLDAVSSRRHLEAGVSILTQKGKVKSIKKPDVILVGVGDCAMAECLATYRLLRQYLPALKVRIISVCELTVLGSPTIYPHAISNQKFIRLFTKDRPVIFNFIGYPATLKGLLLDRPNSNRFQVEGYREEGTTTTFFDMLVRNRVSRFQLAAQLAKRGANFNQKVQVALSSFLSENEKILKSYKKNILSNRVDPDALRYQPESWFLDDDFI